jgi:hypothetical protein
VDPRAGVDDLEKRKFLTLPGLKLRSFSRPARSQSLHRLRSHGVVLKFVANWDNFTFFYQIDNLIHIIRMHTCSSIYLIFNLQNHSTYFCEVQ